jgi:hypothetical protein
MNTTYYIQHCPDKTTQDTVKITDSLKNATDYFQYYCELNPKQKYKIVKRQVLDEVIAESNDFRQETFNFA